MKFKSTVRLFLVVCLTGGITWILYHYPGPRARRAAGASRVLKSAADDVDYLMIETGGLHIDCLKKGRTWLLESPLLARAREEAIRRILTALESMAREEVITASQRRQGELTLEDYGLVQPRARFVVGTRLGREELIVGRDATLGGLVYVKLASGDDVIATSAEILGAVPQTVEDLRDRNILRGTAARTVRVEIHRPGAGFMQVAQRAGQWHIQQPLSARADGARVMRMLEALYALTVRSFVWDPAPAKNGKIEERREASLERYRLAPDEAAARIAVWVEGDEIGKELLLGKDRPEAAGEIYAKVSDSDSIFSVGKDILDVFSVTAAELRDRTVFPIAPADVRHACFQEGDRKLKLARKTDTGWMILEPVQWKADEQTVGELIQKLTRLKAEAFLDGSKTNLAALGLEPPMARLYIASEAPDKKDSGETSRDGTGGERGGKPAEARPSSLLLGCPRSGTKPIYAKFEDSDLVFVLSPDSCKDLEIRLSDPIPFCDRTVLSVPVAQVVRMSRQRGNGEQGVRKDESGSWTGLEPAAGRVDAKAVETILFLAANLRAVKIEALSPKDLDPYGLDSPLARLTLGLSGAEGIQKSVVLGWPAEAGGVFAMVQGQDVVFVLEEEAADRLVASLFIPPDPESKEPVVPAPEGSGASR